MKKMKDRQICLQKRKKVNKKVLFLHCQIYVVPKILGKKVLLVQPSREVKY